MTSASQNNRGCDAVYVVIAVDGDALAFGDRAEDAIHRDCHVCERERIEQVVQRRVQKPASLIEIRHAADAQQPCRDRSNA
jgi:predicted transcriptional regulator